MAGIQEECKDTKPKIDIKVKIEAQDKMAELEVELNKVVAMDGLKFQIRNWLKGVLLDERRRTFGLAIGPRKLPQMAFLGNAGTGKTMIARLLGKLLHQVGMLPTDKVVEVQRTDLVGKYTNEAAPKTREKIQQAVGGILFVDEAHRLVPVDAYSNDPGFTALEEIMAVDTGTLVVIFAGYTKPMEHTLSSNQGIHRRITNMFRFEDYTSEQLASILLLKMASKDERSPVYGFKLHPDCSTKTIIAALIKGKTSAEQRKKMNGGLVDQILQKARENLDSRIHLASTDPEAMITITHKDLAAALQSMNGDEKGKKKRKQPSPDVIQV